MRLYATVDEVDTYALEFNLERWSNQAKSRKDDVVYDATIELEAILNRPRIDNLLPWGYDNIGLREVAKQFCVWLSDNYETYKLGETLNVARITSDGVVSRESGGLIIPSTITKRVQSVLSQAGVLSSGRFLRG